MSEILSTKDGRWRVELIVKAYDIEGIGSFTRQQLRVTRDGVHVGTYFAPGDVARELGPEAFEELA